MNQVLRVLRALCVKVGTPRALAVWLLAEAGEWTQLQQLRCEVVHYQSAEEYWRDCLVTDFLRKCNLPGSAEVKYQAALDTFWACERQNCATNVRLTRYCRDTELLEHPDDQRVMQFIAAWRKEVSRVLGAPPLSLEPRFSGGATFADTGALTTAPDKMASTPTAAGCKWVFLSLLKGTAWERALERRFELARPDFIAAPEINMVRGNVFFTVPKDGTKDRGCAKEPSLNVSFQLALGQEVRKRLQRIGIDLQRGQEVHRQLARFGSRTGTLATLDMSNASDTLCRVLPKLVLPTVWWELFDSLRSPMTRVEGKWVRLEKFSSMGNGFTFELETLIFATLARTICMESGEDPDRVSCYGDDLIVPVSVADSVLKALEFFGFTPNRRKTFVSGPFRESCGGDYWDGVAVRPLHLKELPDEPQHWISLANGLRRVAFAERACPSRWAIVRNAWLQCLDHIPSAIRRLRGPSHLGDIVIHDDESTWEVLGCGPTARIRAYTPVIKTISLDHWRPHVQLAAALLGIPSSGVAPRRGVTGYKVTKVFVNPETRAQARLNALLGIAT